MLVHFNVAGLESHINFSIFVVSSVANLSVLDLRHERLGLVVVLHLKVVPLAHVPQHDGLGQGEIWRGFRGSGRGEKGVAPGVITGPAPAVLDPGMAADGAVDEDGVKLISGVVWNPGRSSIAFILIHSPGDVQPISVAVLLNAVYEIDVFSAKFKNLKHCFSTFF